MLATREPSFGVLLRHYRMVAGLSLADLGQQVFFSKSYLSRVENGLKLPTPDLARRCDDVLNAGGALSRLVRHRPSRRPGRSTLRAVPASRPALPMEMFGLSALESGDRLTPWVGLYAHVRQVGQKASPSVVLPLCSAAVQALRALVVELRSPDRERALTVASRFCVYGGWMLQEAGDNDRALEWTRAGVELAEAAGETSLAAYAKVRHGLGAMFAGRPEETVTLARQAQTMTDDRRVLGLAAEREAQGLAMLGAGVAALRAVDRATELLADDMSADPDLRVGTSNLANPALMVRGWCLHDLGRPAAAAEVLSTELRKVPAHADRARARWGARLALSLASTREIDQACGVLETVLPAAAAVDSASIRADLRRTSAALGRWHREPRIRSIMPALTAVVSRQA